ncbi:3-ketodihydrosphingosine reductase [Arctopsyche grandis]|uniref:3-ketodihydrosphingosine reductase n=1 Tax=Arctopsyche grandis TaxID=121162 RepID=UPI00406D9A7F
MILDSKVPNYQMIIVGCIIAIIGAYYLKKWFSRKPMNLKGNHVLILGGSSGIGLSVAEEVLGLGAIVTIAARDAVKLERAAAKIISKHPGSQQRVHTLSLDVNKGLEVIKEAISEAEGKAGVVSMLVSCAGTAICGRLEDVSEKDVRHMNDLNFLGSLWAVRTVLPSMKTRGEGSIVLVSTQAALLGVYGYSAYGATKWAVRGLGEAILMEVIGTGVNVTICYPPDTDTPGFEIEEASKPPETKLISGSGGLFSPNVVAKQLISDALSGKPYSAVGFEGWLLKTYTGLSSLDPIDIIVQLFCLIPIRIIFLGYQLYFNYIICKLRKEKNTNKKAK